MGAWDQWGSQANGWNAPLLKASTVMGRPADPRYAQWGGICGVHTPMSAFLTIETLHLENFPQRPDGKADGDDEEEVCAGICACVLCSGKAGGVEVRTSGLSFVNVTQRIQFWGTWTTLIKDYDGSLVGLRDQIFVHGKAIPFPVKRRREIYREERKL